MSTSLFSSLGPHFATPNSPLAYLFDSHEWPKYKSSSDIESDPDESSNCKPYTVDLVEQKLNRANLSELSKKHKIHAFIVFSSH